MTKKLGKKRLAELEAKFPLTPVERALVHASGRSVWSYIAYDVLHSMGSNPNRTLPASHVIELVLDASRLEEHMRHGKDLEKHPAIAALFPEKYDPDASDFLWHLMSEPGAFPTGRYGL